jgi:hypothetical protein
MSETTTAPPLPTFVPVELRLRNAGTLTVQGVPTSNPHLAITPAVGGDDGYTGVWLLVHIPTGIAVHSAYMGGPAALRRIADRVSHLDWSSPDRGAHGDKANAVRLAIRADELTEPTAAEAPTDAYGSDIPRAAEPLIRMFIDQFQAACERMFGADKPKLTDEQWAWTSIRQVDTFGLAYLLAAIRKLDPEIADSAAAHLADAWGAGDSLGEWMWQWQQELNAGKPLTLRGIPSPINGPLFEDASHGEQTQPRADRLAETRDRVEQDIVVGAQRVREVFAEIDRLTAERKRLAHLLGYLLRQYERVVEVHALVRMDTEEDRTLHDRAVREFRQAAEPVRAALGMPSDGERHTIRLTWHPDAVRIAEQHARAFAQALADPRPQRAVHVAGGGDGALLLAEQLLTWRDLACLADVAAVAVGDPTEPPVSLDSLGGTASGVASPEANHG